MSHLELLLDLSSFLSFVLLISDMNKKKALILESLFNHFRYLNTCM